MNRKIIGVVTALVLALVGTVALVAYVSTAEDRALEGEELVEVYVVTQRIPAGTAGADIESFVTIEQIPVKVQADGAVGNLPSIASRVAAVDLLPGEQLLDTRFVAPADVNDRAAGVVVPDDLVEITIQLDPARAVGGLVEPGQEVAVFASFEPFDLAPAVVTVDGEEVALPDAVAVEVEGKTPNSTDTILRQVLVTAVQEAPDRTFSADDDEEVSRVETAPTADLLVTLAVTPADAERIVFTAEFGFVWLALDGENVPLNADPEQTRLSVYATEEQEQ